MEQHGRVLIVDDNAMNVDVLRRILRKEYELDIAANGDECLAKVSSFKPQLVLLDIMMPGIDGYETCRRIKSKVRWATPCRSFLVSGKGTTADRVHGYEAQADDYVVKPFDHDELLSKVRAHFRLRSLRVESQQHEANQALARLCSLVNQMSTDISEHTQLIEEIQRELSVSGSESPDALIHAMVRLADTNKATQGRLAAAERKLREQAQEIASHASEARTDALTLLPNRRAFDEELARRIAEADRGGGDLCAVMIDIDHFKHFNDQYGHPAGDEVLQAMGRVLGRAIRQMDLVARYGGDEFAALMPACSFEDARCECETYPGSHPNDRWFDLASGRCRSPPVLESPSVCRARRGCRSSNAPTKPYTPPKMPAAIGSIGMTGEILVSSRTATPRRFPPCTLSLK